MFGVDISQTVYNYIFVTGGVALTIWGFLRHSVRSIVNEALHPVCEDLQKIKYQLYNNGGESMKDAIDRIESDAVELKINQAIIKTKLESQ